MSSPSGIACGTCAAPPGSTCPQPATQSDCTAMFDVGTSITLALTEQQTYFAIDCSSPIVPLGSCTFVLAAATTVDVTGAEAVR